MTWFEYFRLIEDPRYMPHAGKIKGAGLVGFGGPVLLWLGLLVLMLKPKAKSHGDALPNHATLNKAVYFAKTQLAC